jgi:hypothetical protein
MSNNEARIVEFPVDDRYWRIDVLGVLMYPIGLQSEPSIAVHLTELHSTYEDPLSNRSVIRGNGKVIHLKIGQIASLNCGEVWRNQLWVPHRRPPRTLSVILAGHQFKLCRLGDPIPTDNEDVHLLNGKFTISSRSSSALGSSWAVIAQHPSPNVEFIVIPSAVLFQRCLATSPAAIRRIAWGQMDRIVSSPQTVHSPGTRRALYVEVDRDIRSEEAFTHASLLVDPSGKREYLRFRNNMKADGANNNVAVDTSRLHYIKFGFPFNNPATLHTRGKFLPLEALANKPKRWGFLVTKIETMELDLVFDRLIVHRKNDGTQGENADAPDLQETAWLAPPKAPTHSGDEVPLHSGEDPNTNLTSIHIAETGGLLAIGLELVKDPKITQQYRRKMIVANSAKHDGTTTTGEPNNNSGGSTAADIESHVAPQPPVTLELFFKTLELLRSKGYPFHTVTTNRCVRFTDGGDSINFLPREISPLRSWHRMSDAFDSPPRGYVVTVIHHGDVFHYFIEMERKKSEAHTLAHIRTTSGEEIDARRFHFFMIEVARNNGWGASFTQPNWKLERIRHSPARGITPFAAAILRALNLDSLHV